MSNHTLSLCLEHLTPSGGEDSSIYDAVPLRRVRAVLSPIERFRMRAVYDADAESPRSTDTCITTMFTWDRNFSPCSTTTTRSRPTTWSTSRGGDPSWTCAGSPGTCICSAGEPFPINPDDVLAFAFLYRDGQGGLMTEFGVPNDRANITDPSLPFGWMCDDDRADGIVFITRRSWEECMGDSPIEGGTETTSAREVIEQEVHTYNTWQEGGFVGVILEEEITWQFNDRRMKTWEHVDSCFGFESIEAAREFALELATTHNLEGE